MEVGFKNYSIRKKLSQQKINQIIYNVMKETIKLRLLFWKAYA